MSWVGFVLGRKVNNMSKNYLAADGTYVDHPAKLWDHPDKDGWVNNPWGKRAHKLAPCPQCGEMAVVVPPYMGGGVSCGYCDTQTHADGKVVK